MSTTSSSNVSQWVPVPGTGCEQFQTEDPFAINNRTTVYPLADNRGWGMSGTVFVGSVAHHVTLPVILASAAKAKQWAVYDGWLFYLQGVREGLKMAVEREAGSVASNLIPHAITSRPQS